MKKKVEIVEYPQDFVGLNGRLRSRYEVIGYVKPDAIAGWSGTVGWTGRLLTDDQGHKTRHTKTAAIKIASEWLSTPNDKAEALVFATK